MHSQLLGFLTHEDDRSKETKQMGLVQGPPASPQHAVVSDYIYGATGGCLDWLIYTAAQELIR